MAVDKWRQYLQHAEFIIYSDHRSLSHLTEQRLTTPWQQRVFYWPSVQNHVSKGY
jgi:hypothetical protein